MPRGCCRRAFLRKSSCRVLLELANDRRIDARVLSSARDIVPTRPFRRSQIEWKIAPESPAEFSRNESKRPGKRRSTRTLHLAILIYFPRRNESRVTSHVCNIRILWMTSQNRATCRAFARFYAVARLIGSRPTSLRFALAGKKLLIISSRARARAREIFLFFPIANSRAKCALPDVKKHAR